MVTIFEKKFLKKCQHRSIFTTHGTVRWQSSQLGDWPSLCISSIHSALKSLKKGQNKSPTLAVSFYAVKLNQNMAYGFRLYGFQCHYFYFGICVPSSWSWVLGCVVVPWRFDFTFTTYFISDFRMLMLSSILHHRNVLGISFQIS